MVGSSSSYGAGLSDVYLIKTDLNGDALWTKAYGTPEVEGGGRVIEATNKRILVTGGLSVSTVTYMYLLMVNDAGDTIWTKRYKPDDGGTAYQYSCRQSTNSYIIMGNSLNSDVAGVSITNIDTMGMVLWSKSYKFPGNCDGSMVGADGTEDEGFIIAGNYCLPSEAWLMRIDSSGNLIWIKIYTVPGNTMTAFYDVKQTPDGGFIAVGETGDFFKRDVYVVKTDANGNSGCGDSTINLIVTDVTPVVSTPSTQVGSGGIVGNYTVTVSGTNTTDSTLCFDTITGVRETRKTEKQKAALQAYPNPFSGKTTIAYELPLGIGEAELTLTALSGRIVQSYKLTAPHDHIEINSINLGAGFYITRIIAGNITIATGKLVMMK